MEIEFEAAKSVYAARTQELLRRIEEAKASALMILFVVKASDGKQANPLQTHVVQHSRSAPTQHSRHTNALSHSTQVFLLTYTRTLVLPFVLTPSHDV